MINYKIFGNVMDEMLLDFTEKLHRIHAS